MVRLPFKDTAKEVLPKLGDSYTKSVIMLHRMKPKFFNNPEFKILYKQFMQDYIEPGHMSKVPLDSPKLKPVNESYFLLHHGVLKPSGLITKLRTVFNWSSKTNKQILLNDLLRTRQDLLPEVLDLINHWRSHKYVFMANVQLIFRQI